MYVEDFQERKKLERIFFSWPAIIATSVLVIFALSGVFKLWQKERNIKTETAAIEAKIAEVKAARDAGIKKIESLKTAEGIDEEARGRFNLKKEGEEMVIFLDTNQKPEDKGFWAKSGFLPAQIWQSIKNWLTW